MQEYKLALLILRLCAFATPSLTVDDTLGARVTSRIFSLPDQPCPGAGGGRKPWASEGPHTHYGWVWGA